MYTLIYRQTHKLLKDEKCTSVHLDQNMNRVPHNDSYERPSIEDGLRHLEQNWDRSADL